MQYKPGRIGLRKLLLIAHFRNPLFLLFEPIWLGYNPMWLASIRLIVVAGRYVLDRKSVLVRKV
jgi:hypothetical protein